VQKGDFVTPIYRQASLIPLCLALATPVAFAQTLPANTVRLQATGQTIEASTSWNEKESIRLEFPSELPKAHCEQLRITYLWHDDIKEPEPLLIEKGKAGTLQFCEEDANRPTFVIARENPNRKMLTYVVWEVLSADSGILPSGSAERRTRGDKILKERDRLGLQGELVPDPNNPDPIKGFITNIETAFGTSESATAALTAKIALDERTLAAHEADAKLYAGISDPAGLKALDAILTNIRAARVQLNADQDARTAESQRLKDLKQLLADVRAYRLAVADQQHLCERAKVLKIGGLLPSERSKSVYYNFTTSPAPPDFTLLLMAGYPRITQDDRLFAIVANRQLSVHPYPFALSVTKQVSAPPLLGAVRPTFDITKAIAPGTERTGLVPLAETREQCDAKYVPVEEQSLRTAYRDSVLPFQDRFVGNDILGVSIATYLPYTTSDKVTTKTDGGKTTVTKENVEESKVVDLLKDVKYPQVRALYRFNFAMGVIVSRLKEKSFVRMKTAANDPDTSSVDEARYMLQEAEGTARVFPAFLFSTYLKRVDIQDPVWSRCKTIRWCPGWRALPAPSIGFALTNPADNAFVGITSEVFENIHFYLGGHNGKISELLTPRDDNGEEITVRNADRDSADPKTQPARRWGFSYGVTFNINIVGSWFK